MANLEIQKIDGSSSGNVELTDAVFGVEVNERCVRAAYNQYMAGRRSGTHSVKTRNTVSGGGKKPWKQKGTGRARAGSSRSPIWRGGAVVHGPSPRDYDYRINKKEKRAALTSLLTSHVEGNTLTVVADFDLAEPKTKLFTEAIDKIGVADARRLLIVTAETNDNLLLASRNIGHVKVVNANNLNVFDLLTAYKVVVTKQAAEAISESFSSVDAGEVEQDAEAGE